MTNKKLSLILAVLAFLWIGAVGLLTFGSHLVVHRHGPLPSQPIEFSHTVHVNDLNLECLYCHETAEKSIHATIPKGDLCLSCHEDADIDNTEVKKMIILLEEQDNIKWERVYQVKDHVYFSHRVHTTLAKIECQECHGPIENMIVAVRAAGGSSARGFLEMGWCVTCHRKRGASLECITCHK
jgi:hypothetical protein